MKIKKIGLIILLAASVLLAACAEDGAQAKVCEELDALKSSDPSQNHITALQEVLTDDGSEYFDRFLAKLRDFDYEVIGSEKHDEGDTCYTKVTVKINTYDFGREYLETWKDYLKEHGDDTEDGDMPGSFYEELFKRLASAEDKRYVDIVDIIAIETDEGKWLTNISGSEELQDALFGGMISEMEMLAE